MRLEETELAGVGIMDKNLTIGFLLLCVMLSAILFGILTVQVLRCCNLYDILLPVRTQVVARFRSTHISASTRRILGAFGEWQVIL